jgi:hypothetical protein
MLDDERKSTRRRAGEAELRMQSIECGMNEDVAIPARREWRGDTNSVKSQPRYPFELGRPPIKRAHNQRVQVVDAT